MLDAHLSPSVTKNDQILQSDGQISKAIPMLVNIALLSGYGLEEASRFGESITGAFPHISRI